MIACLYTWLIVYFITINYFFSLIFFDQEPKSSINLSTASRLLSLHFTHVVDGERILSWDKKLGYHSTGPGPFDTNQLLYASSS